MLSTVHLRAVWFKTLDSQTVSTNKTKPVHRQHPFSSNAKSENNINVHPNAALLSLSTPSAPTICSLKVSKPKATIITVWGGLRSRTWGCMVLYGAVAARVWFQIQGGFGCVGEITVEAQRVARGGGVWVAFVLEHCADEGGFHGVEVVKMLLICPKRRRLGVGGGLHWGWERRERKGCYDGNMDIWCLY